MTFNYHGPNERCTIGTRELHCGDCFILIHDGKDISVRIEHSSQFGCRWYLKGIHPQAASDWNGAFVKEHSR
jgi:Domain of unknown function (DUF5348)